MSLKVGSLVTKRISSDEPTCRCQSNPLIGALVLGKLLWDTDEKETEVQTQLF